MGFLDGLKKGVWRGASRRQAASGGSSFGDDEWAYWVARAVPALRRAAARPASTCATIRAKRMTARGSSARV